MFMKKLLSICFLTLLTTLLAAQVSKTVNVTTAGTLSTLLNETEITTVTNLTITGSIDARDFKFMRDDLSSLSVLDLSASTIQSYSGIDGTISNSNNYLDNEIPSSAFLSKTTLNNVILPSNLISISNNAFESCSALTGDFIIPSTVTNIGDKAFFNCSNISGTLILPYTIVNIGNWAFSYCKKVSEFRIQYTYGTNYYSQNGVLFKWGNGFTELVNYPIALINTTYNIPNGVTSIGKGAFGLCGNLTNITIPNSVKQIKHSSFNNCVGLTEITLPNSIEIIDSSAFLLCTQLKSIKIPDSVTEIKANAFWMCYALSTLSIGSSIKTIENQSFNGCDLKTINILTSNPPHISYASFGSLITPTCSLIVPVGSKSLYQTAEYWKDFANISENTTTEVAHNLNNKLKISTSTNEIIIHGISEGETVTLYTINGKPIKSLVTKGESLNITVDRNMIYLVKTGEKIFKVIL